LNEIFGLRASGKTAPVGNHILNAKKKNIKFTKKSGESESSDRPDFNV